MAEGAQARTLLMRGRQQITAPAPTEDEEDVLILSVALANGHFESSLRVPLYATEEERKGFIDAWFGLIEAGLKVGHAKRLEDAAKKAATPQPPPPAKDD